MKVLVLAGGESNERQVSLTSGGAVFGALERLGHDVAALDPATGRALLPGTSGKSLRLEGDQTSVESLPTLAPDTLTDSLRNSYDDTDVVFVALHGGAGENGSIQNLLDLAGIKYTGSGMAASALCMDKALTKDVMKALGIPTPPGQVFRKAVKDKVTEYAGDVSRRFDLPLIVKPADGGSTIGLTKVEIADQIGPAFEKSLGESPNVLVEEYIAGRELTVAVFDGKPYPLVEIVPVSGLYDYEAKYTKGKSEYIVPADVPPEVSEALSSAAARLFDEVGCRGLARVDFILREDGRWFCLEINTVPGLTELSLAPMAMGHTGIGFDRMIQMMVEAAVNR